MASFNVLRFGALHRILLCGLGAGLRGEGQHRQAQQAKAHGHARLRGSNRQGPCPLSLRWLSSSSRAARETCLRYVTDARQRANLCGAVLHAGATARAWAELFAVASPQAAPRLLEDDDWAVRWSAGAGAGEKKTRVTEPRALARLGSTRSRRASSSRARPRFTSPERVTRRSASSWRPAAAAKCWSKRDALKTQVEIDLYSAEPTLRREEALAHLAAFAEKAPGAGWCSMRCRRGRPRPTSSRPGLLARGGWAPAGKALLEAPKTEGADTPLVNRLLAIYAKQIDALRAEAARP